MTTGVSLSDDRTVKERMGEEGGGGGGGEEHRPVAYNQNVLLFK